ncbi:MAG: glutamine synthetase type III, partial [Clostridia bacterium]|nr:glutamine synthetase type III [Clostridia bacterium]
KLGILSKTEHNEGAPSQHELAPIFTTTNIACDHNQLTMELMQRVAKKHDLICLLHEKPFEGVNGSGKHNNWSLSTNTGVNLLDPGETPYENAQFLLFLCAIIKAVDEYQDLLRASVATAGNDHRLGANEAPPAVVSMFLGDELNDVLDAIERGQEYDNKEKTLMKIGVHTLPRFSKDTTDRNRTSPFAFTNNKFEFRMLGSSLSVAEPNFIINTAVGDVLERFADILENAEDFEASLNELIIDTIKTHKRIIFNGNGYDDAWIQEAKNRGLSNLPTTPDALPALISEKSVELFTKHKVLSEVELRARYEINLEHYCKVINIEALTMIEMVKKDILPAVSAYGRELSDIALTKKSLSNDLDCTYEEEVAQTVSSLTGELFKSLKALELIMAKADTMKDNGELSFFCKDEIIPAMEDMRKTTDELETMVSSDFWPYPSYGDLLFGVR